MVRVALLAQRTVALSGVCNLITNATTAQPATVGEGHKRAPYRRTVVLEIVPVVIALLKPC